VAIILNGQRVEFPNSRNFLDDPRLALNVPEDGYHRAQRYTHVIPHKIVADADEVILPGDGPPDSRRAENVIAWWDRNKKAGAAHFVIDYGRQVLQTADPYRTVVYGASRANKDAAQFEMVEEPDGRTHEGVIDTGARLMTLLADHAGMKKQLQASYRGVIPGIIERWHEVEGAFRHGDVSARRSWRCCGNALFALAQAKYGWVGVDFAAIAAPVRVDLPKFLDPGAELPLREREVGKAEFVSLCVLSALRVGYTVRQAVEFAGNCVIETGWGSVAGWLDGDEVPLERSRCNLGGVKARERHARAYASKTGGKLPYWKRRGHQESGDDEWEFYLVFESPLQFAKFFREKLSTEKTYAETWRAFQAGGDWYRELVDAGYKGDPEDPGRVVRNLHACAAKSAVLFAQLHLKLRADGKWGPLSEAACREFQRKNGLPDTGVADDATLGALARIALAAAA
jgi:peptidoglycan hydrolase-like protein with peptidoglycan-binding domain